MKPGEEGRLRAVLAVGEPLLLAAAMTAAGALVLGPYLASAWFAAALGALVIFLALLTFKQVPGWNVALLTAFAAVGGGFVAALFPKALGWGALAAAALLVTAAIVSSGRIASAPWMARLAWALSWIYLAGWPILAILRAEKTARVGWAAGGLLVFFALAACWFAGRPWLQEEDVGAPLAIEVYLIGLNLLLAAAAIATWVP